MKKIILSIIVFVVTISLASAQILPTFQIGLKAGANLSSLNSTATETFSGSNRAGYLAGIWARFGAVGFNFQPEMYLTSKDVDVTSSNGGVTTAKFTSIDVPLLFGGKFGALGIGGRFYTGPVISFTIDKNQSFNSAAGKVFSLNYQDQNFAWQFGTGLDIKRISVDLRYEAGITKQTYDGRQTRISLFNLSLAYSLVKL
ncbi:outer membrane beta-barrel protein [uncultured Mucilaginibacter sp.]|uniref:outer membrane beta-barrel protein n=1 Tax=uncultured Mucilaginibacter sp. TaxID=797541 RepID=UPI0025E2F3F0|nr:outer membrane beta-barrel protein [uncultured Mucilaginibacter sp.]